MRDVIGWRERAVTHPEARLMLSGPNQTVTQLESWEVQREITTTLPEQVRLGTGASVASAKAVWLRPSEPDGSWQGTVRFVGRDVRLQVRRAWDEDWLQAFIGSVWEAGTTIEAAGESGISLDCDDPVAGLRGRVNVPAVVRELPAYSYYDGEKVIRPTGNQNRYIQLTTSWVVDHIARQVGFRATTPVEDGCLVNATLMGSTWPEVGSLRYSRNRSFNGMPRFASAPWGVGCTDCYVSYQWLPLQEAGGDGPSISGAVWRVQFQAQHREDTDYAGVFLRTGDGSVFEGVELAVLTGVDGPALALRDWDDDTIAHETLIPLQAGDTRFATELHPQGDGTMRALLATQSVTGWFDVAANPAALDTPIWEVLVRSNGSPTGGVSVSMDSAEPLTLGWAQTSHIDLGETITALPPIKGAEAWATLRELAEAESGGLWVDETGTLTFWNRSAMTSGQLAPDGTIPELSASAVGLSKLDLQETLSETYDRVEVPLTNMGATWTLPSTGDPNGSNGVDVWTLDETIEVPPGSIWERIVELERIPFSIRPFVYPLYGPAPTMSVYYLSHARDSYEAINYGVTSGRRGAEMTSINTMRVWVHNTSPDTFFIRGEDNPDGGVYPGIVVRADAVIFERDSTIIAAPSDAGEMSDRTLSLEANPWRQRETETQAYADWLYSEVAVPRPSLRKVQLAAPDPRIQLGDRRRLIEPDHTGLSMDVVVVGSSMSGSAGEMTQTVTVRPRPVTWGQMDQYLTWADIEALGWQGWNNWRPPS